MADWNELDLGGVDAYAAAVKAGYTGTRQQWMTAMQNAEANGLKAEGYANGKQNGTAVESGTYFHDNAQYYKEQAEAAKTAAQAAQAAAETAAETDLVAWLAENITNPDSPPLDRTLASSSSAAPADMVGDLKSAIVYDANEQDKIADDLYGSHNVFIDFQLGRYAINGYNDTLHSYINGKNKLPAGTYYFPEIDQAYDYSVLEYVSDAQGTVFFDYRYKEITRTIPNNCILSVRKVNGVDFTATEIENIKQTFIVKKLTSETGALDTLTEMSEEVSTWEEDVFGEDNPIIDLEPVQGYFLSGGFGGETSDVRWRTKNKIPAGTYKLTNSDPDYRYYWVDYGSDSSGTVVFNSRSDDVLYKDTNDFYLTFCHKDLDSITASDVTARFTLQKIQTSNAIQAKVDRLYSTQKVVFMGDSIFGLERSYTSIPSLCGYYTGATTYNCAIGGTAALEHPNDYKYFDLGLLTDAIIAWGSGDTHAFDNQVAHQSDSGNPSYIPDVITTLKSLDFTKINVLVISIGANDWVMNFGTNDQILDAIKTSITNMVTAFPNLRVLLMNPPFKFKTDPSYIDCDTWVNNTGTTLTAFARRYKEVGEACHIQIVNAMDDMGICRYNRSQWFIAGDGSHPNETGRKETAKLVTEYLKRYLYD